MKIHNEQEIEYKKVQSTFTIQILRIIFPKLCVYSKNS